MKSDETGSRASQRIAVLLHARCRKSSWHVFPVELGDVSHLGCSIVGCAEPFVPGQIVRLSIANMKPIEAQVRWIGDTATGLQFTVPLADHVIAQLAKAYGIEITAA
ncbi:PilZ domain-containing protein [Novosphingobium sp. Leaf2]|uniref:PilZ domain-containing protein n=1 Tax=Novosphingobium sp. Leaf2 TaxID=1735670 RepID=UPI0006FCFAAC|nr:PilZ domain-containing protein [Novosphingobium sp. Leaf2]KQM17492.1 pilus assembly protein PilZ [Novosphingobium sp. Leaf2]